MALGLDQGSRALVPLGVLPEVGPGDVANGQDLGRRDARLFPLCGRVSPVRIRPLRPFQVQTLM
jgi:hypothetical protein